MLGHPDPALLYSTYRELVSFDEAKAFWDIIPNSTLAKREAKQEQERIVEGVKTSMLDDEARERAEMSSNVGKAFKGEDGRWIPSSMRTETRIRQISTTFLARPKSVAHSVTQHLPKTP